MMDIFLQIWAVAVQLHTLLMTSLHHQSLYKTFHIQVAPNLAVQEFCHCYQHRLPLQLLKVHNVVSTAAFEHSFLVVLQPTSTRQESSHHVTDSVTVIVGVSVTALITVLFFILCALIAVVCRLKRRYIDFYK